MKRLILLVAACAAGCASQQATTGTPPAGAAATAAAPSDDKNSPSIVGIDSPTPNVRLPPNLAAQLGVTQPTPATPSYLAQIANHCPTTRCQAIVQVCEQGRQCILTPQ